MSREGDPKLERLTWPDAFKFIAMCGVIFIHLPAGDRFGADAWRWVEDIQAIFGWCVVGFFAVAGLLCHDSGKRSVGQELVARARRLLLPWLSFSILYKVVISILALAGLLRKHAWPADTSAASILEWVATPADPQLYFLVYLFGIQAVALAIHRLSTALLVIVGIAAGIIWVWMTAGSGVRPLLHGAAMSLIPLYFAYFSVGMGFGSAVRGLALCATVFAVLAGLVVLAVGDPAVGAQLLLPWLLLLILRGAQATDSVKAAAWLGRFTGAVYVWHAPVLISACAMACIAVAGNGLLGASCTVVATFGSAALIGVYVNRIPALSWFRI